MPYNEAGLAKKAQIVARVKAFLVNTKRDMDDETLPLAVRNEQRVLYDEALLLLSNLERTETTCQKMQ